METLEEYYHRFNLEVEGVITAGINFGGHPLLAENGLFQDAGQADDAIVVSAWLHGLREEYGDYRNALRTNFGIHGGFVYPRDLGAALDGVLTHFQGAGGEGAGPDGAREGVTFNQGTDGNGNQG